MKNSIFLFLLLSLVFLESKCLGVPTHTEALQILAREPTLEAIPLLESLIPYFEANTEIGAETRNHLAAALFKRNEAKDNNRVITLCEEVISHFESDTDKESLARANLSGALLRRNNPGDYDLAIALCDEMTPRFNKSTKIGSDARTHLAVALLAQNNPDNNPKIIALVNEIIAIHGISTINGQLARLCLINIFTNTVFPLGGNIRINLAGSFLGEYATRTLTEINSTIRAHHGDELEARLAGIITELLDVFSVNTVEGLQARLSHIHAYMNRRPSLNREEQFQHDTRIIPLIDEIIEARDERTPEGIEAREVLIHLLRSRNLKENTPRIIVLLETLIASCGPHSLEGREARVILIEIILTSDKIRALSLLEEVIPSLLETTIPEEAELITKAQLAFCTGALERLLSGPNSSIAARHLIRLYAQSQSQEDVSRSIELAEKIISEANPEKTDGLEIRIQLLNFLIRKQDILDNERILELIEEIISYYPEQIIRESLSPHPGQGNPRLLEIILSLRDPTTELGFAAARLLDLLQKSAADDDEMTYFIEEVATEAYDEEITEGDASFIHPPPISITSILAILTLPIQPPSRH